MVRGYDGDLIEEAAEEHNLFFFYGSQLAYEAELDGLKDGAEAAEKERTAAEEKAENVTEALANETLVRVAAEEARVRLEKENGELRARLNKLAARANPDDAISSLKE